MKRLTPTHLWGDHAAQLAHFTRQSEGCWEFVGFVNPSTGYGQLGRNVLPHRLAWEIANGRPVPDGLVIDHTCHNADQTCRDDALCPHRRCVNPNHLEAVTFAENVTRGRGFAGVNAAKSHCPHGHEFTPANTYEFRGHRQCRACRAVRNDINNAKRRQATAAKQLG